MKACWCTLPLTDPNACKNCPNNKEPWPNETNHGQPFTWPVITPIQQPVKRVIEEFDEKGRLIRRTTEEDVFPASPMYRIDCQPSSTTVGDPTFGLPTTTCTTGGSSVNVIK